MEFFVLSHDFVNLLLPSAFCQPYLAITNFWRELGLWPGEFSKILALWSEMTGALLGIDCN